MPVSEGIFLKIELRLFNVRFRGAFIKKKDLKTLKNVSASLARLVSSRDSSISHRPREGGRVKTHKTD